MLIVGVYSKVYPMFPLVKSEFWVAFCLLATYDLDKGARERLDWGLFRDRRSHMYQKITE